MSGMGRRDLPQIPPSHVRVPAHSARKGIVADSAVLILTRMDQMEADESQKPVVTDYEQLWRKLHDWVEKQT